MADVSLTDFFPMVASMTFAQNLSSLTSDSGILRDIGNVASGNGDVTSLAQTFSSALAEASLSSDSCLWTSLVKLSESQESLPLLSDFAFKTYSLIMCRRCHKKKMSNQQDHYVMSVGVGSSIGQLLEKRSTTSRFKCRGCGRKGNVKQVISIPKVSLYELNIDPEAPKPWEREEEEGEGEEAQAPEGFCPYLKDVFTFKDKSYSLCAFVASDGVSYVQDGNDVWYCFRATEEREEGFVAESVRLLDPATCSPPKWCVYALEKTSLVMDSFAGILLPYEEVMSRQAARKGVSVTPTSAPSLLPISIPGTASPSPSPLASPATGSATPSSLDQEAIRAEAERLHREEAEVRRAQNLEDEERLRREAEEHREAILASIEEDNKRLDETENDMLAEMEQMMMLLQTQEATVNAIDLDVEIEAVDVDALIDETLTQDDLDRVDQARAQEEVDRKRRISEIMEDYGGGEEEGEEGEMFLMDSDEISITPATPRGRGRLEEEGEEEEEEEEEEGEVARIRPILPVIRISDIDRKSPSSTRSSEGEETTTTTPKKNRTRPRRVSANTTTTTTTTPTTTTTTTKKLPATTSATDSETVTTSEVKVTVAATTTASKPEGEVIVREIILSDHYSLEERLGSGPFGVVFRTEPLVTLVAGEEYAVKQVRVSEETTAAELSGRLRHLKTMNHPSISLTHDFVLEDGVLSHFSEYFDLASLQDALFLGAKFTEEEIAVTVSVVVDAISHLHNSFHVHRDIRAANVMLTSGGETGIIQMKLTDVMNPILPFVYDDEEREVGYLGAPYWLPPEVLELKDAFSSADIWSIGILAIELATGHPPLSEHDPDAVRVLIPQQLAPALTGKKWSRHMVDFVEKCCVKDPRLRPTISDLQSHRWLRRRNTSRTIVRIFEKVEGHYASFGGMDRYIQERDRQMMRDTHRHYCIGGSKTAHGRNSSVGEGDDGTTPGSSTSPTRDMSSSLRFLDNLDQPSFDRELFEKLFTKSEEFMDCRLTVEEVDVVPAAHFKLYFQEDGRFLPKIPAKVGIRKWVGLTTLKGAVSRTMSLNKYDRGKKKALDDALVEAAQLQNTLRNQRKRQELMAMLEPPDSDEEEEGEEDTPATDVAASTVPPPVAVPKISVTRPKASAGSLRVRTQKKGLTRRTLPSRKSHDESEDEEEEEESSDDEEEEETSSDDDEEETSSDDDEEETSSDEEGSSEEEEESSKEEEEESSSEEEAPEPVPKRRTSPTASTSGTSNRRNLTRRALPARRQLPTRKKLPTRNLTRRQLPSRRSRDD